MCLPKLIAAILAATPVIDLDPSDCEAVKLSLRDEFLASLPAKHADAGVHSLALLGHSERGSAWSAIVELDGDAAPYFIQLPPNDPRAYICPAGEGVSTVSGRGGRESIAGRVVMDSGLPLTDVRISADLQCCNACSCPWGCECPRGPASRKYEPPMTTRTDQAGGFVLRGLVPGRYNVWVEKPGYGGEKRQIETGAPAQEFIFVYRGLVRLRATRNGAPVADAVAASPGFKQGTSVDPVSGLIELTLPPGEPIKLEVSAAGVHPRIIEVNASAGAPGPPIDVPLSSGRRLKVTVIDEAQQPVPRARVAPWTPSGNHRAWGIRDEDWTGLVTGSDGVAVLEHFDDAEAAAVTVDSARHVLAKVDVPTGRAQVTARLQPGGSVFGRVLDRHEHPYPNVYVELSRSDYLDRRRVTPDRDGRYEIRGLAPGEYTVYTLFDQSGRAGRPPAGAQVIMRRIRHRRSERMPLDFREGAATLTVVVSTNDRYPESVELWRGDVVAPRSLGDLRAQGDTVLSSTGSGQFQAWKLTAGSYTLRVVTRTHRANVWGMAVDQRRVEVPLTGDVEIVVAPSSTSQVLLCEQPDCSK